ncbi:MAG TPA: universal stress protein [Longimicrobiaceae bacterium]
MEQGIRNIVLGVAELEPEDPQLAPTLRLAEALGATLHVVHAYHLPDPVLYPYPEMPVFSSEHLKEVEEQTRTRLEAQVQALSRGASIVCRAVPLPAEKAILDVADEVHADLVVVGATRRGTLARTILGTTAQRVVRAAKAPVLVRRREEHDQLRRILFTTDLSDHSEAVYRRGRELTAILGRGEVAEHRVLLVLDYDVPPLPPLSRESLVDSAMPELERFLRSVDPSAPGSIATIRIGEASKEIVAEASDWKADLLVVGTHGRKGASRFLIGSVAEGVVRTAMCDVLVIPSAALAAQPEAQTP